MVAGRLQRPAKPAAGENWWSNGPAGPCGPDSEIFAWTGDSAPSGTPGSDDRWLELWNHVTMRYHRLGGGSLVPLPQRSIDTGMGLDRLMMVTGGLNSVFETEVFLPWLAALDGLRQLETRAQRLICDHARSAVAVPGDGVQPANTGRGYALRRLLRRALTELWHHDASPTLAELPVTLLARARPLLSRLYPQGQQTEDDYKFLHQTHGLPHEAVTGIIAER